MNLENSNQALISRFLVSNGSDALDINVEFKAPFDTILEPIKDNVAQVNQARRNGLKKLSELVEMTKNHIRNIYGCDFHVSDSPNPIYPELTSNEPNFFMVKSSSKDFLVERPQPSVNTLILLDLSHQNSHSFHQ